MTKAQLQAKHLGYYAAVVYGRYNHRNHAFEWKYDENHGTGVDGKKAARTIQRLKDGHNHITADPVHGLTREEAAYMLAHADELLREINRHE